MRQMRVRVSGRVRKKERYTKLRKEKEKMTVAGRVGKEERLS